MEKQYGAWVMCSAPCQAIPRPLFWGNSRAREQNEEFYLLIEWFSLLVTKAGISEVTEAQAMPKVPRQTMDLP